ncbi:carboxypeptidase-like regulatory domain-containing protein, partial [Phocaeicola vulgatus]|nr:carboxypeptidase-like regulatory domain-containing protein [Phocaeicola vulgatus]
MKNRLLTLVAFFLFVPLGMLAQNITAKGIVFDSAGEAIIGASVVEKGNPSNGTITDFDGKFTLAVSKGKRIVISFVGYET